jgi:hypothetical protein
MRTPTWGSIRTFCKLDGWRPVRATKHAVYQKVLNDGTALETRVSQKPEKDEIGPGLFQFILRTQLQVSAAEFWAVIDEKRPARRPQELPAPPSVRRPSPSIVKQLERVLGLGPSDISALSHDDAVKLLNDHRSRPRDEP